jgi:hypothetical protein
MAAGTDVVCQHNTNTAAWESAVIRANAHELGYLVVFLEPTHAWTPVEDLPAAMRKVLVSIHDVPAQTIRSMGARKEEILPRYLAYWLTTSSLVDALISRQGLSVFNRLIISFDHEAHHKPVNDTTSTLPPLLHITTDHIGTDKVLLEGRLEELNADILSPYTVKVTAIFVSDDVGIGALVQSADVANAANHGTGSGIGSGSGTIDRYEKYTSSAVSRAPTPATSQKEDPISNSNNSNNHNQSGQKYGHHHYTNAKSVPALSQHARTHSTRKHAPHITLYTKEGRQAADVGAAAYEFRDLLLRSTTSSTTSTTTSSTTSASPFHEVTIGKYKAIIFSPPIVLNTTYAANYTDVTANKMRHFSWRLDTEEEEDVFTDLLARYSGIVKFTETAVPTSILPVHVPLPVSVSEPVSVTVTTSGLSLPPPPPLRPSSLSASTATGAATATLPSAHTAAATATSQKNLHWTLADAFLKAPKGKSDDEVC